jgi:hypothetical protein
MYYHLYNDSYISLRDCKEYGQDERLSIWHTHFAPLDANQYYN